MSGLGLSCLLTIHVITAGINSCNWKKRTTTIYNNGWKLVPNILLASHDWSHKTSCFKGKFLNWNSHISPSRVSDYPAVLSPCASSRLITQGYFAQHSLSPRENWHKLNETNLVPRVSLEMNWYSHATIWKLLSWRGGEGGVTPMLNWQGWSSETLKGSVTVRCSETGTWKEATVVEM